ncbi:MAG: phosphate-starvation-inducible PsiE family protein [Thiohalospira sp.]|uniref:phosphate-starvation-inducible PsiE family protein n=1 Tax=Thiohalospira sp. TaxID=3080549 RepID=UPI00398046D5
MTLRESLAELREHWPGMSLYERFEQIISLVLVLAMAVIVIIAVWQLLQDILALVRETGLDPMDQYAFQQIFGAIMIVLIAMEFKYSIVRVVAREDSIIQVKTVLLIGMLALARKFIILDTSATDWKTVLALAGGLLALGGTYWLVRERDLALHRQRRQDRFEDQGEGSTASTRKPPSSAEKETSTSANAMR